MGKQGKGLTAYLALRTGITNKKQKSSTSITAITHQDFRKLLKKFKNLPHLVYMKKQVQKESTEDNLFTIKQIFELLKSKNHIMVHNQRVK